LSSSCLDLHSPMDLLRRQNGGSNLTQTDAWTRQRTHAPRCTHELEEVLAQVRARHASQASVLTARRASSGGASAAAVAPF
jgi:hypothetical protein